MNCSLRKKPVSLHCLQRESRKQTGFQHLCCRCLKLEKMHPFLHTDSKKPKHNLLFSFFSHYSYVMQYKTLLFLITFVPTKKLQPIYFQKLCYIHFFLMSFQKVFQKRDINSEWSCPCYSSAMQATEKWERRFETSDSA